MKVNSQESLGQAYQLWIVGMRHLGDTDTTNKAFLILKNTTAEAKSMFIYLVFGDVCPNRTMQGL